METAIFGVFFFMLGAVLASFAGAVAWRLHVEKNFVSDRSECEHCKHKLSATDLVPVFSWLWLRGKCRYCKKPIDRSMVVAEVLFGIFFLLSYVFWPFGLGSAVEISLFGLWLVALTLMAVLFVYDQRWGYLPDKVVAPLVVVALVFFVVQMFLRTTPLPVAVLEGLYALAPIAGLYGLLYAVSRGKWIGFGDVKLGIALGLLLGWQGALVALVLANFIGFLYVLPALVTKKTKTTAHIPFGPFLIVATVLALLWGDALVKAYFSLANI